MANPNLVSIGRFSSQMLTYLGTQRTVKITNGVPVNTFKWSSGPTVFPTPGNISQSSLGLGVIGNYSAATYDSTKCYFLSRGASELYADTMTGLTIDMASTLGVSVQSLLEKSEISGRLLFSSDAYRAMNIYRDPGNQIGTATTITNKFSLQAKQIRG